MKYILIALIVLSGFTSCKSLKSTVSHSSYIGKSTVVQATDTSKIVISKTETDIDTTKMVDVDTEVTVIQTDTTTVNGKLIVFPKTVTTTKTTKKSTSKGNTSAKTSSVTQATGTTATITKTDVTVKEGIKTKQKFNNTAIERLIYLFIVLTLAGYIIIKKYFPSIFVKIIKLIK